MRGKDGCKGIKAAETGITPAYAGKSQRGDITGMSFMGSPPPMRGKVSGISSTSFGSGITPAYAGKSTVWA